jgi:hypothetical protein
MLRLIGLLVVVAVIVAGIGWYRGWFQVSSTNTGQGPHVTVTVDKDKIQSDKQEAKEKVEELKDRVKVETK